MHAQEYIIVHSPCSPAARRHPVTVTVSLPAVPVILLSLILISGLIYL